MSDSEIVNHIDITLASMEESCKSTTNTTIGDDQDINAQLQADTGEIKQEKIEEAITKGKFPAILEVNMEDKCSSSSSDELEENHKSSKFDNNLQLTQLSYKQQSTTNYSMAKRKSE